ncbi:hypothetical protein KSF73_13255 [Burkholderiaceae bacterium DAT-1]|nr:hypothetical protein [Burkholderiaceae bacterium DAT-1]
MFDCFLSCFGFKGRNVSTPPCRESVTASIEQNVYSHVTREENVPKIVGNEGIGLDPARGGQGGASAAVGKARFVRNSTGFIHLVLDKEGVKNRPSEFYTSVFHERGIESRVLNVTVPQLSEMRHDPDDRQGGRYKTQQAIPQSHIVPIPLTTAFRPVGEIGADYAPHDFVKHATRDIPNRTVQQRTEDIRRAVHKSDKTIF